MAPLPFRGIAYPTNYTHTTGVDGTWTVQTTDSTHSSTLKSEGEQRYLSIHLDSTDETVDRVGTNLLDESAEPGKSPSFSRDVEMTTTTTIGTVHSRYKSSHREIDDQGHAVDGTYSARTQRTNKTSTFDENDYYNYLLDPSTVWSHTKRRTGDSTTVGNYATEQGSYNDKRRSDGTYVRDMHGQFTTIVSISNLDQPEGTIHSELEFNANYSSWFYDSDGTLGTSTEHEWLRKDRETTKTVGNFGGGKLISTKTKATTEEELFDRKRSYEDPLDDGGTGWTVDHWQLREVIETKPNAGTGETETAGQMSERIAGTKTHANTALPTRFYASPNFHNSTLVPFDYTDYMQTVSLVDGQGNTLLHFDKTVALAPEDSQPRPAPPTIEELIEAGVIQPANGDSWWWAGTKAFTYEFGVGVADLITDEIPYLSQAKALDKLVNDRNLVTGEDDLGALDRASSVLDLIPFGSTLKRAGKGLGAIVGLGGDVSKSVNRAVRNSDKVLRVGSETAQSAAKTADDIAAAAARGEFDDNARRIAGYDEQDILPVMQPGGGCFSADTPVATPHGPKPIGQFRVGETVLAFDHERGTWSPRRVEKVHRRVYEDSLVTIHTETDSIRATVYHPVWVLAGRNLDDRPAPKELEPSEDEGLSLSGRWVNSHDLRPGDVLFDRNGEKQYVIRIEQEFVSGFAIVNLTVEGDHTFAVGESGLLVHNTYAKPVRDDLLEQNGMREISPPSGLGMQNPIVREAAEDGDIAHLLLQERLREKGWLVDRADTAVVDPATGKTIYPDAISPAGHPVEIKPRSPTGERAGRTQLDAYERATGRNGRVIYHDFLDL